MANYGFQIYSGKKTPEWESLLPSQKEEVVEKHVFRFFEAMFERQEIWYRRFVLKQDRPWTQDRFLRDYKFTNVYRELDRSSQYLIENVILKDYKDETDLFWKICFYRLFNNPETFKSLGGVPGYYDFDQASFRKHILKIRNSGQNPFTNAYLINSAACPGMKRDDCYCNVVLPTLHSKMLEISTLIGSARNGDDVGPEKIVQKLMEVPACATFVSHEIYIDFCYIERYTGKNYFPFNQNDFTNVGPGASLGLRLIFPSLQPKQQIEGIYMLRDVAPDRLSELGDFKYLHYDIDKVEYYIDSNSPNITLHQIEMWLCEYSKLWKMEINMGKQRSKFKPKTQV